MKIDIYAEADSNSHVFVPTDVEGRGVGAAELHIIDLASELARQGNQVRVYNSCPQEGTYENGVEYLDVDRFIPQEERDAYILHRNPSPLLPYVNAKVKLHSSCDQQTSGDYARDIFPYVSGVCVISQYHANYFVERYHLDPSLIHVFDIGVRIPEYLGREISKVPYRCIYTSTPSRGLKHLAKIFPAIRFIFPQAELYITAPSWGYGLETQYHPDTELFRNMDGVYFLGKLPREQLTELQLSADVHLYPNDLDGQFAELYCVSVAESQVAGTVVLTTKQGGLETTVMSPSRFVKGTPQDEDYIGNFIGDAVELLSNRKQLAMMQNALSAKAQKRFSWNRIGQEWIRLIENLMRN